MEAAARAEEATVEWAQSEILRGRSRRAAPCCNRDEMRMWHPQNISLFFTPPLILTENSLEGLSVDVMCACPDRNPEDCEPYPKCCDCGFHPSTQPEVTVENIAI